jgi:hypothetical protein
MRRWRTQAQENGLGPNPVADAMRDIHTRERWDGLTALFPVSQRCLPGALPEADMVRAFGAWGSAS